MHSALDVVRRQQVERVARVDGERRILGLHPLPLVRLVVLDLKRGNGLAEEQSPGTEIGVTTAPETADFQVFFGRILRVLHVAEVILDN